MSVKMARALMEVSARLFKSSPYLLAPRRESACTARRVGWSGMGVDVA